MEWVLNQDLTLSLRKKMKKQLSINDQDLEETLETLQLKKLSQEDQLLRNYMHQLLIKSKLKKFKLTESICRKVHREQLQILTMMNH